MSGTLYSLVRSALFCLPAEASHGFALTALNLTHKLGLSGLLAADVSRLAQPKKVLGIEFPHLLGLAAGLDKNADHIDALQALGFGFLELGTLTPRPQPGNPKPRLFRIKSEQALINRMGFNNKGIEHACRQIGRRRSRGILGINLGKNFDTPVEQASNDYLIGLRRCYDLADYVTINISSPNTPGLRRLQFGDELNLLLDKLKTEQAALTQSSGRYVPLLIKMAPDLSTPEIKACCAGLLRHGIDGVIATNTTLDRSRITSSQYASEAGGLSGAPLTESATAVIAQIKSHVGDRLPIIGVGGIMSAEDAIAKLNAGADLLQIYSGFIFNGPALITDILRALLTIDSTARPRD